MPARRAKSEPGTGVRRQNADLAGMRRGETDTPGQRVPEKMNLIYIERESDRRLKHQILRERLKNTDS